MSDSTSRTCGRATETIKHYMLDCPNYAATRDTLLATIRDTIAPGTHPRLVLELDPIHLLTILLHGSFELPDPLNVSIFVAVQSFILATGRFSRT